jgi:hypothetical protein
VSKYIDEFTNLSCYTVDDIDTDAKRKNKFLEGLNDELSIPLSVAYTPTFQMLLDQAIILENKMKESKNRKRKHSYKKIISEFHHKISIHSIRAMEDLNLTSMRTQTTTLAITTTILVETRTSNIEQMDMIIVDTRTTRATMEVIMVKGLVMTKIATKPSPRRISAR